MLIRSSLTRDQVFLFDVQQSTSGYCMIEGRKYGSVKAIASSSVQSFNRMCLSSICAGALRIHACMDA